MARDRKLKYGWHPDRRGPTGEPYWADAGGSRYKEPEPETDKWDTPGSTVADVQSIWKANTDKRYRKVDWKLHSETVAALRRYSPERLRVSLMAYQNSAGVNVPALAGWLAYLDRGPSAAS